MFDAIRDQCHMVGFEKVETKKPTQVEGEQGGEQTGE